MSPPTHRLFSLALSFFVVFQFQFEGIAGAANDLIIRTCNIAAARDRNNVHVDLCVKALAGAPGSESANLFELGAISIELVREKATETLRVIEIKLKKKKNKKNKAALKNCEKLYTDAAAALRVATADYLSGRYGDATTKLSVVMTAVATCEDGFKEKHVVVSPLAKRNANAFQLSAVSLSIIAMRPRP